MHRKVQAIILIFSVLSVCKAASVQNLEEYIKTYVYQNVTLASNETLEVSVLQVDEKIKLPSCSRDLKTYLVQQGFSNSSNFVKIQCDDTASWQRFFPVQIRVFTDVVAARRMIKPGEMLKEEDLKLKRGDKYQLLDGYFASVSDVEGNVAARFIAADSILGNRSIKKLPLVERNQSVQLVVKSGSIEIIMRGIARSQGFLHDRVKVLNPSSKREITGVVTGQGVVAVP